MGSAAIDWERGASAPLDVHLPHVQAKRKLRGPGWSHPQLEREDALQVNSAAHSTQASSRQGFGGIILQHG